MRRWPAVVVLAAFACGGESRKEPPAAKPVPADAAVARLDEGRVRQLLEAVAACALTPTGVEHECPEKTALNYAYYGGERPDDGSWADAMDRVARTLLDHESPAVRVEAFTWMYTHRDEAVVARAIAEEPDPAALVAKIFHAPSSLEGYPKAAGAILGHLDHPAPAVRLAVLRSLVSIYNAAHPGLFEHVVALVDDDPDDGVRADACMRLGALSDPRAMPVFERMLVAATPPAIFEGCAAGLVNAWLADPQDEHPVEAAYHRTLALLRKGPHRIGAPGVMTIQAVGWIQDSSRSFDELAPWVDLGEVRAALGEFVASRRADRAARIAAVEIIREMEPSLDELRALRKRVADEEIGEMLEDAESWIE
jgi:hypothetical protein